MILEVLTVIANVTKKTSDGKVVRCAGQPNACGKAAFETNFAPAFWKAFSSLSRERFVRAFGGVLPPKGVKKILDIASYIQALHYLPKSYISQIAAILHVTALATGIK